MKDMREEAKKFAEFWTFQRGSEKGEAQSFWNSLLRDVLGVEKPEEFIKYEVPIIAGDGTTKFLDGWIPSTRVLIEHKSRGIKLDEPQAGHNGQTPFEQAKAYDNLRPTSEKARWIVVSNFDEIRIHDMEHPAAEYVKITLSSLKKEAHRLNFLVENLAALREKELEVSVKAGRVVGKLYNAFLEQLGEEANNPEILQLLNKLCVRLVFCVYAEDAGVFEKDQFLNFLKKFHPDSYHLQLGELFKVLSTKPEERGPFISEDLKAFPYVGGALFKEVIPVIPFSEKTAAIILNDASEHFDWSEISPTIFGAVFESTLNPETRRKGGMHYTSEENIHKVIDPLFLDELKAKLAAIKAEPNQKKRTAALEAFQVKLGELKFLDPACGSGNFLTETYISLRKLENEALEARFKGQGMLDLGDKKLIHVSINQFYGIEINDFAVTVAQTAMWIAECKMLEATNSILSKNFSPLPLTDSAKIIEGNALRMDWEENLRLNERLPEAHFDYIMGNPPFIGYSNQSPEQKKDMLELWLDEKGKPYKTAGKIDYVTAWYWKAAEIMRGTSTRGAFVSTNSITQGEQVAAVWKPLKTRFGLEIDFAWKTFVWDSEATDKAHVHVVVIGFDCAPSGKHRETETRRFLYDVEGGKAAVKHINGYLVDADDVWIENRTKPLCDVQEMTAGNRPADGGHLIIEAEDYEGFIEKEPQASNFIKKLVGAVEFINNKPRYCLWLKEASPKDLRSMPLVMERIEACRKDRLNSPDAGRRKLAETSHLFRETMNPESFVIVPAVSSERREYVPLGFAGKETIATNLVNIIPNATLFDFGVLTSSVHMAWMRTVCGRLKSDYRYSAAIVYNNFPWPAFAEGDDKTPSVSSVFSVAKNIKQKIEKTAQAILDARALPQYKDCSLADLYDPLTMPPELRRAHAANDAAVMEAYGFDKSLSEGEIVAKLFEMYAELMKK